ncbi:MAG: LacI family transcriptional regulator [Butyrivibrio sp.]|nr:LacI family transcriptional regulator [Butyrivibrio sp.]
MGDEKLTISDIAEALGVSKTTVSRAISGKGRIGSDTKRRVKKYIEEHNYTPNALSKSGISKKTYNIAVVWPGDIEAVDLPFFQKCLIGMSETAAGYGYDILVSMILGNDISSLRRIVENKKVDGVVLTRTLVDDLPAAYLKASGVPFVAIGSSDDDSILQIDNDNFEACKELTSILLAKGMNKIGLIGGSTNHVITRTRYNGFKAAHEKIGESVDENLVFLNVDKEYKLGGIVEEMADRKVDCVICMDDSIAGEVLAHCRLKGIHIPEDLRIASFYNSSILESAVPAVTSLNFNVRKLGSTAFKLLLDKISGEEVHNVMLRNYEVILKESTK